jgi:mono/diheme cytochrome c family protein
MMKLRELSLAIISFIGITVCFVSSSAAQPAPSGEAERRALFLRGAQLWPVYCNTCHNARTGAEFSPAEWEMILMHMRTQANLTPQDASAILEYLRSSR